MADLGKDLAGLLHEQRRAKEMHEVALPVAEARPSHTLNGAGTARFHTVSEDRSA